MNAIEAKSTIKAINRHLRRHRVLEGGLKFGLDHITWSICHPHMARMVDKAGQVITGRAGRFLPCWRYSRSKPA